MNKILIISITAFGLTITANQELLRKAIVNDSPAQITDAITQGASVNSPIVDKHSLFWAVLLDKPHAIEALLAKGAILDRSLLDIAMKKPISPLSLALVIKACGESLNAKYMIGGQSRTLLQYSLDQIDFTTILWLIRSGADCSDKAIQNLFSDSLCNCYDTSTVPTILEELLLQGYPINNLWFANAWSNLIWNFDDCTPAIRFLIANGANPNHMVKSGQLIQTPLIYAIRRHSLESVKILLKAGAHVNAKGNLPYDPEEKTPLAIALEHGNAQAMELLLEHGANL